MKAKGEIALGMWMLIAVGCDNSNKSHQCTNIQKIAPLGHSQVCKISLLDENFCILQYNSIGIKASLPIPCDTYKKLIKDVEHVN